MRYFFHFVSDDSLFEDETGQFYSSFEEALAEARSIAACAEFDAPQGHAQFIAVVNGKGEELARAPIQAREERPGPIIKESD